VFGGNSHKYIGWLRFPRLFTTWRLYRWVKRVQVRGVKHCHTLSPGIVVVQQITALQGQTAKVSMATSILRLLLLLTCVSHMVGCAWWYVGALCSGIHYDLQLVPECHTYQLDVLRILCLVHYRLRRHYVVDPSMYGIALFATDTATEKL
jgi:hypothetical protein